MKYFKNVDEMTLRDIAEVIYTSAYKLDSCFFPPFKAIIGENYKSKMLDTLIYEGCVSPQYRENLSYARNPQIPYILDIAHKVMWPASVWSVDDVDTSSKDAILIASYFSAIIIHSNHDFSIKFFNKVVPGVGALASGVNEFECSDDARDAYSKCFKPIDDKQWEFLQNLYF